MAARRVDRQLCPGTKQAGEDAFLGWPRLEQHLSGDLAGGVAKRQSDHDHIIERSNDGQELWDQVDG